jgi:hypothetical protein
VLAQKMTSIRAFGRPCRPTALLIVINLVLLLVAGCGSEDERSGGEVLVGAEPAVRWDSENYLAADPVRPTVGLALQRLGWKYDCMECHRMLKARWHHDRPLVEHRDLVLEHGANRFCLNCHHATNRNAFVDYDGSEIAEQDVVLLCGKCHGPIYRDWKRGIHGRQNGSWRVPAADRDRLRCIQCHDPHRPAFRALRPEVGPVYPSRAAGSRSKATAHGNGQEH